jgi:hypothetical protein
VLYGEVYVCYIYLILPIKLSLNASNAIVSILLVFYIILTKILDLSLFVYPYV